MNIFKKTPVQRTPSKVKKYRKETHDAAADATEQLTKLNKVMGNGITLKIYLAAGGKHHHGH